MKFYNNDNNKCDKILYKWKLWKSWIGNKKMWKKDWRRKEYIKRGFKIWGKKWIWVIYYLIVISF